MLANRKTFILSSRQSKKAQNINPVVTATGKMPKHQSCRHGNWKRPKTSILSSRHTNVCFIATTIPHFQATEWMSKPIKTGFQHSARNRQIRWNPLTPRGFGPLYLLIFDINVIVSTCLGAMWLIFFRLARIRKHVHKCPFTDTSLSITERGYIPALAKNPLKNRMIYFI